MSDSISEAEKIRNKRLAKLGAQSNSTKNGEASQDNEMSQNPPTPSEPSKPKINIAKPEESKTDNPFSKLALKPVAEADSTTMKRDASGSPRPQARQQPPQQSFEKWEDSTLCSVFRVTLNPEQTKDSQGNPLYHLADLKSSLEEDGQPIRLSTNQLEQAIIEAVANRGRRTPFEYLLSCWKRVSRLIRNMRLSSNDDPRSFTLQEAKRLSMSYCSFALTMPEMFDVDGYERNPLVPHLLAESEGDRGISLDFLNEAVSRFPDDDGLKEVMISAMEELSLELAAKSMNDDFKPYVQALRNYVRFPPLVVALAESPSFLPEALEAQDIETKTILGPFFRLSPMQGEVAQNYFDNPRSRDRRYITNSQNALRLTLNAHQTELFDIADRFIKNKKEVREKLLDWFALTVNLNHKRRAMRPDPRYISTDGFMVNVTVCLDRLCEPFMDQTFTKIGRIEPEYLRRAPRIEITDETMINADQQQATNFFKEKADGESNFISEVFFLTVAAHHYGTEAANTKLSGLRRDLKHMDKQIEKLQEERQKYASNPEALARFDTMFNKYKQDADKGHCVCHAIEGILLDEVAQARAMLFMRYVIVWLIRLVSGVDFPRKAPHLPLPTDQPAVFNCLPEYFIEDIVDHFKFVTSHMPHAITTLQCDELVTFCITCLRSTEYIKNPYLKSGLVSILFYGTHAFPNHPKGILGDLLNSAEFALENLLHSLMQFYIDCETTGAHTQFYDKFNIRYEIFQVIKCIWGNSVYRNKLAKEAQENVDFFVRFVNLLLNDVTFVLDESFDAFNNISSLQKELRSESAAQLDENVRKEKEEALDAAQGKAKNYMVLTSESLLMFKLFTDALADAFTIPEVVQRLADMLDYNLDALVGPKQSKLRVENPEEYNFDPKRLVSDIMTVFLNLSGKENFLLAVARDGRSYKPENFERTANIMVKYGLKSGDELMQWRELAKTIERVKAEDDEAEQDLGDIPDEFTDPLMATLMQDPVILPISRQIVDRSTIRQHLLSDPHDPFNRTPLKIEDVIQDTELKAKIDAFKAEKKAAKRKAAEEMDVTED